MIQQKTKVITWNFPFVVQNLSKRAKRLIKSYEQPGRDESSLPKKDDIRLSSTMSHSYVFYPHPITPTSPIALHRPVNKPFKFCFCLAIVYYLHYYQ